MRENVHPVRGWVLSVVMLLWLSVSVFAVLVAGRANHTATTKYKGTWKPAAFYNRSKSLYQDELNTLEKHIQTVHARYTKPKGNTETLQSGAAASSASSNATGSSGSAGKKKYLAANLFILGAQKAGTSSLFAALKRHMFFCSGHKEPHFFHYDHEYVKGRAFYEKYFIEHRTELRKCTTSTYSGISTKTHVPRNAPAGVSPVSTSPIEYTLKPRRYFIDGSTMLHNMREVAPRIKEFYDDEASPVKSSELKFIVLLREPVARDYSCFQHYSRNAIAHIPSRFPQYALPFASFGEHGGMRTMKEVLEQNMTTKMKHQQQFPSLLNYSEVGNGLCHHNDFIRGEYASHIREFLKYFDRSQLMIMNSDFVVHHHREALLAIADFTNILKQGNETNSPAYLREIAAFDAPNYPHADHDVQSLCVHQHVPKLDCSFRDRLAQYYRPWNSELMKLLNETQSRAPKSEPPFAPFHENEHQNVLCVKDARKDLDALIRNDISGQCPKPK
jgi:hypothetical protein